MKKKLLSEFPEITDVSKLQEDGSIAKKIFGEFDAVKNRIAMHRKGVDIVVHQVDSMEKALLAAALNSVKDDILGEMLESAVIEFQSDVRLVATAALKGDEDRGVISVFVVDKLTDSLFQVSLY